MLVVKRERRSVGVVEVMEGGPRREVELTQTSSLHAVSLARVG